MNFMFITYLLNANVSAAFQQTSDLKNTFLSRFTNSAAFTNIGLDNTCYLWIINVLIY